MTCVMQHAKDVRNIHKNIFLPFSIPVEQQYIGCFTNSSPPALPHTDYIQNFIFSNKQKFAQYVLVLLVGANFCQRHLFAQRAVSMIITKFALTIFIHFVKLFPLQTIVKIFCVCACVIFFLALFSCVVYFHIQRFVIFNCLNTRVWYISVPFAFYDGLAPTLWASPLFFRLSLYRYVHISFRNGTVFLMY